MSDPSPASTRGPLPRILLRGLTWLLAAGCFYLAYRKIDGAAAENSQTAVEYVAVFFSNADWALWLGIMIPYSLFFFLVDSYAICRVINWFNTRVRYLDILPVRASTYILALVNEQVGKGAMAVYLYRRDRVPGWEVGSSMLLIAFVEIYQLLLFSSIGTATHFEMVRSASQLLPLATILPAVYAAAGLYLVFHLLYFQGRLAPGRGPRERTILYAFRQARLWQYLVLIAIKGVNLIAAVAVYSVALSLFRVDVAFGELLAFLPVIFLAAALPLPFHAGALALWTVLFPKFPEVGIFSLVMHTFFVLFNAAIGLAFLPRANRELFGDTNEAGPPVTKPS